MALELLELLNSEFGIKNKDLLAKGIIFMATSSELVFMLYF